MLSAHADSRGGSTRKRLPNDPSLHHSSARSEAVAQLLRIEFGGAYTGLVSGQVGQASRQQAGRADHVAQGAVLDADELDDLDGSEPPPLPPQLQQQQQQREQHQAGRPPPNQAAAGLQTLDARDQRQVKDLVSGVTRWRRRLDYILSTLTGSSVERLEPAMRQVLRLGVYELALGGLPGHALGEHVELAKAWVRPAAGGFANGVLRSAARRLVEGTLPDPAADMPVAAGGGGGSGRGAARRLAVAHSHPTWMVSRWLRQLGPEATQALLEHNNRRPVYGLRLNRHLPSTPSTDQLLQQLAAEGVSDAAPSSYLPSDFVRVSAGLQSLLRPGGLVAGGGAAVQDEAAGLAVMLLDPQPGDDVLDACAAPGGKTLFAASRMRRLASAAPQVRAAGQQGSVLALDVSGGRLRALAAASRKAGLDGLVSTCAMDLRQLAQLQQARQQAQQAQQPPARQLQERIEGGPRTWFSKVLLDAPCSGTGVLAKRADLRWRRTPEQLAELLALQRQLLAAAALLVQPGGLLVYSTCSIEPEECGGQVDAFLASPEGHAFAVEPPPPGLVPDAVLGPGGCVVALPHVHGIDGAYAVRLRRRAQA